MAHGISRGPFHDTFGTAISHAEVSDYDDPMLDIDIGPTTLKSLYCEISTGNDVLAIWDLKNPTIGSDDPDFVFPTADEMTILWVSGGRMKHGLSFTVANAGATALSGDPSNANTLRIITSKGGS
jgi:hypothetical protein